MSCIWKSCPKCEGSCLWERGMKRLFSASNLEPCFYERININCSDSTKELLSKMWQIPETRKIILIESADKAAATILSIKCLQNYFNQVAEEAAIEGMGVYIPVVDWIKKGLSQSFKDKEIKSKLDEYIKDSKLIVWDILTNLTDYQKDEFSNAAYSCWMKGKGQIINVFPNWRDKFRGTAVLSLFEKAKVILL